MTTKQDEWRGMDSAPKDGGDVLLFYSEFYDHTDQIIIAHWNKGGFWVWQNRAVRGYSFEPTHWMPLPTPPQGHGEK